MFYFRLSSSGRRSDSEMLLDWYLGSSFLCWIVVGMFVTVVVSVSWFSTNLMSKSTIVSSVQQTYRNCSSH